MIKPIKTLPTICVSALLSVFLLAACTNSQRVTIANGTFHIKAGKNVQYRIEVTPVMNDATLNGKFMASGGAGNDVSAALADESNSVNWINGHEAHVLWGTNGQKTTDHFEVKLQPGIYYLSISNAFSIVSDKDIDLNLNLTFKR